ncbi:MAG: hypothetical protein AB1757_06505 [Acidobacteriota bacterium]
MKIITIRRHKTFSLPVEVLRRHCPVCQCEVEMMTTRYMAKISDDELQRLVRLIETGQAHAMQIVNGSLLICTNSPAPDEL